MYFVFHKSEINNVLFNDQEFDIESVDTYTKIVTNKALKEYFLEKSNVRYCGLGPIGIIPFFYIITYFYIKIKAAIALINSGKHMDCGPIARSQRKIAYGRADREFRCSRAVRDRQSLKKHMRVVNSGKMRAV